MYSFRNKRTRYELHNRDYIMLNNELSLFSTKGKSSKGGANPSEVSHAANLKNYEVAA